MKEVDQLLQAKFAGCIKNEATLADFLIQSLGCYEYVCLKFKEEFSSTYSVVYRLNDDLSGRNLPGVKVDIIDSPSKAKEMCMVAATKYMKWNVQHPKRTYRLPGLMVVNKGTLDNLILLNKVKGIIESSMFDKAILSPRSRGKFFKSRVKNLVMLKELYRKVVYIDRAVERVSFTWGNHVPQSHIVSKEDVIGEIEADMDSAESVGDRLGWLSHLRHELDMLRRLSDNVILKKMRPVPPHPRCNVLLKGSSSEAFDVGIVEQKHAYLPIFVSEAVNPKGSFLVEHLRDSHTERRAVRPEKNKGFEPFIERLGLYKTLC